MYFLDPGNPESHNGAALVFAKNNKVKAIDEKMLM